jgi:class 3 adenylate cyclase
MTNAEKRGQALRKQRNALLLTIESIEGTVEYSRIKSLDAIVSILNAMIDSAERKLLTVSFCDIKGFAEITERLEPEVKS